MGFNLQIGESNKSEEHYRFIANYFSPYFSIEQFLDDEKMRAFTIVQGGVCAAVSLVTFRDNNFKNQKGCLFLYTVVEEQFRNRGLNRILKQCVEQRCREWGGKFAIAHVRHSNLASLASLKKCGYSLESWDGERYKNGDQKLLMYKRL